MANLITNTYEHALQCCYWHISNRGIRVDTAKQLEAAAVCDAEINRQLGIASNQWGCPVFIGAANAPAEDKIKGGIFSDAVNLNATKGKYAFLPKLKDLGYKVPTVAKKNEDGEWESKESAEELVLRKMIQTNQFGYPGGDPALKAVLKVREFNTLKTRYLEADLYNQNGMPVFLSTYNVAGTTSGRRSCTMHTFGYGGNAQTFPKHGEKNIINMVRSCYIARPGNVFLMGDQISAEDWPVSALSENHSALVELRSGTDRHTKLAASLFNIPIASKSPKEWKDSMERYLGKKTRHATNYDERAGMMSDSLIKEGFYYSVRDCETLLNRMSVLDPNIKSVFHRWVQEQVSKTRTLITPLGRERVFLGARPTENNSTVMKEAYAFIPQSTVGDNTGLAVLNLETAYPQEERAIVQEGHDSIVQDIRADAGTVYSYLQRTEAAFSRKIRFHNGIELEIPIEAEVGFDFAYTVKIKSFTFDAVKLALEELRDEHAKRNAEKLVVI